MNSKICLIIICLIGIALLSYPAVAESGSVSVSLNTHSDYGFAPASTTSTSNIGDWIRFLNTSYTGINNIKWNNFKNTISSSHSAEITTFTIITNGSGSGIFSYSIPLQELEWDCNTCVITGNNVRIIYANPQVWTNITFVDLAYDATSGVTQETLTTTKPIVIGNFTTQQNMVTNKQTLNQNFTYNVSVFVQTQNSYVVTYPFAGKFQIDVTKGSIGTNDTVHSATKIYFNESTYNTGSFSVLANQLDGIFLNVSIPGAFTDVLINSSGFIATPPNASNPNAPNCVVNCIETSKFVYNNTESINIFGSFYPATSTTTDCLFFGFFCTNTTINTESTTGFVFIKTQGSTSPVKFLQFNPDQNNNYNLFTNLDIGTYQAQLFGFAAPGSTCTNGIVYDFPFIPLGCYYPHNITTFQVVNNSGNLSIIWQTKLSNSSAIYGDTVTVAWQNVTANDIVTIFDENNIVLQNYNINQSNVNQIPVFIPLFHIGTFTATIFNGSNHNHNVSAFLNVLPPGSVDVNNSFGITMFWSKATDVINNPTQLNWNTGTFIGNYTIDILKDGVPIQSTQFTSVPGQSQNAQYTFATSGAYIGEFVDSNGSVQQQATIRIADQIATSSPAPTPPTQQQQQQGTINFIGSMSFVALIIFIIIVGTGFIMGGLPGGLLATFAILPLMFLAPGDFDVSASSPNGHMIPLWVLFLEFAIVMMIIAVFAANKLTKTGGDQ